MESSVLTTLSFLVLLFSTKLVLTSSASHEPVHDINGDEVKSSLSYFAVSVIRGGGGGGLNLRPGINGFCPFEVYQEKLDVRRGGKINFSPYDNSTIVTESTDLNVKFELGNAICGEINPPIWQVRSYDNSTGQWFITASGSVEEGNPGAQTLLNWFKIERVSEFPGLEAYKFVHCPSVCESCVKFCNSLQISDQDRRLALAPDDILGFHFVLIPAPEDQLRVN